MSKQLSVLLVEDNPFDSELLLNELCLAGFAPKWKRVDTEQDYLAHLHEGLDLVVSDFGMPKFSGLRALELLQQKGLEVPFIIVSGTIGEETAVAAMKLGAADYLLKDRLARLGAAVTHALNRSRLRRDAKNAELALRESEERFRQMAENINEVFWMTEPATNTRLYVSPAYEAIWGRTSGELYAQPLAWEEAIHPEDRARVMDAAQVRKLGGKYHENYRIVRPDGSMRWIRDRGFSVRDERGDIYRLVGTAEDITDAKKAETRAGVLHAVVEVLAEALPFPQTAQRVLKIICAGLEWDVAALWMQHRVTSTLSCVETWSSGGPRFRGFVEGTADVDGQTRATLPANVWGRKEPIWLSDIGSLSSFYRREAAVEAGLRTALGFPIQLRGENFGVVELFSTESRPFDAELLAMLEVLGTQMGQFLERKRLEEQFLQAQKLEAIGTLAGGIAHDFNNVLQGITGYIELVKMEVGSSPVALGYLDAASAGTKRAADLVRQILAFSRIEGIERKAIRLGPIVVEAIKLLRPTIPDTIQFDIGVDRFSPCVLADPTQIHQVIMNLVTNAAHAMKNAPGRLGVSLEEVVLGADAGVIHPGLQPGQYMHLIISDTGCGMDEVTVSRIFEPFFTTKAIGEGTGLGLSVVHGIMQSHDAVIMVESQRDQGAVFHLYFPVYRGPSAEDEVQFAPPPRGNRQRILFVDDEAALTVLAKASLERLGYLVETYTVPSDAVDAMRQHPEKYDLVVTDLNMPGMTGSDLARRMLSICPDVPIILMTGYAAGLTLDRVRAMGIREMLLKPLSTQTLAEVVNTVLRNGKLPAQASRTDRNQLAQALSH